MTIPELLSELVKTVARLYTIVVQLLDEWRRIRQNGID